MDAYFSTADIPGVGLMAVSPFTPPDGLTLADCFPPDLAATYKPAGDAQAGWVWDEAAEAFKAPPAPSSDPVVPAAVTSVQAKIQLSRTPGSAEGKTLLNDVTAAAQAAGIEAQIWFTEARTWERSNSYVASLSKSLDLTSAQVDQLFIEAAQIAA
jgi:hypothetical protein